METKKSTGGHFTPCNVWTVEAHNERDAEYMKNLEKAGKEIYIFPEYSYRNSSWIKNEYEGRKIAEIFDSMKAKYKEKFKQTPQLSDRKMVNKKTGKTRTISGWSPIREMVVPIKEDTKIENFKLFENWMQNKGVDVIRIDLHFDEGKKRKDQIQPGNFHAHVVCSFFDWQTAKTVKLDAKDMSEMQTVLAVSLGMERGIPKAESGKEYLTHQEYREMKEEENRVKKNIIELKQNLDKLSAEEKLANTRLKGLTTMINNLILEKEKIELKISKIEDDLRNGKISQQEMMERTEQLLNQLRENEEKITEKKAKLVRANQQLDSIQKEIKENELAQREMSERTQELQKDYKNAVEDIRDKNRMRSKIEREILDLSYTRNDLVDQISELQKKFKESTKNFQRIAVREMESTAWRIATEDFSSRTGLLQDFIRTLTPEQRDLFEATLGKSIINDMDKCAKDIITVSTCLFLGYIDSATNYAQSHGGGGNPEEGWGRKKDDDDDAWRRKCFFMGMKMMKPSQERKRGLRR